MPWNVSKCITSQLEISDQLYRFREFIWGGWQVPSCGPPCTTLLEMSTKPITTGATTATPAGYVQLGVGRATPGTRRGSSTAAAKDDPRPSLLQLNMQGLEQIAYKNKAFIIVLQETHCTTTDKLVTPPFSLAGSVLNRKDDLATFVHELVDQSPEQPETEWLCVDVAGYMIIYVYKFPR